jgi:hypothetical protein
MSESPPFCLNWVPGTLYGSFSLTRTDELDIFVRSLTIMRQFLIEPEDNLKQETIAQLRAWSSALAPLAPAIDDDTNDGSEG